ncbi:hemolysin type calcium-binding protein [Luteimonas cucumeris]|uniref:Hemolysin type calcium-binding protein n=1 Tax=Luteimonas cucumeris TaxID=985012 RepID=A0A562LEW6_9GAMM|nr:M91 family zinc metallopeptidase [Luteimonas cucumeris]TWI06145.1 hemolysin type calcium-binding protein [Luteimonas cucumeris]
MTVQLDPAVQSPSTPSYWDNPAEPETLTTVPTSIAAPEPEAPPLAANDAAIAIDGSDTGTRLPSGQTPDGKSVRTSQLAEGEQSTVTREQTIAEAGFGQTYVSSDQLVVTTRGTGNDDVQVTQRDDGTLDVSVNGESYEMRLAEDQELTLRTGAGNDTINVASNVKVNIVVDGGAGDDSITTGAGNDRIDGGTGNDSITTGAGRDDIFGNTGNDRIEAGSGDDVVYGGDGDDVMLGNDGVDFLEGGQGKDDLDGGAGSNMLSGGLGDDVIRSGGDGNRIYTGDGTDAVEGVTTGDKVYAQQGIDAINFATGARDNGQVVVNVELDSRLGTQGVKVEGSEAFRQRIGAEIEFLRSSPNGQQMLAEFDAAAANGNTVTIRELANEQNGYAQTLGRGNAEISNGRAGEGSDVIISYNPSFHMDAFPAPVVVLYHEMSHAYNGVNGTFQPGTYTGPGPDQPTQNREIPNAERQAVGLETSATPFDFDGDPRTPATTANPDHLTENGLREELGLPDRPSYSL